MERPKGWALIILVCVCVFLCMCVCVLEMCVCVSADPLVGVPRRVEADVQSVQSVQCRDLELGLGTEFPDQSFPPSSSCSLLVPGLFSVPCLLLWFYPRSPIPNPQSPNPQSPNPQLQTLRGRRNSAIRQSAAPWRRLKSPSIRSSIDSK